MTSKFDNNSFKFQAQEHPNNAYFVPKLNILFLPVILQLGRVERVDFKYDNNFLKFQPKNSQIKALLIENLRTFILAPTFAVTQI